jgi:ABC-type phosphate transport system ATPase subunit
MEIVPTYTAAMTCNIVNGAKMMTIVLQEGKREKGEVKHGLKRGKLGKKTYGELPMAPREWLSPSIRRIRIAIARAVAVNDRFMKRNNCSRRMR